MNPQLNMLVRHRLFRLNANMMVTCVYAICALTGGSSSSWGSEPAAVSSLPIQSRITTVQPMTGIVLWQDNPQAKKLASSIALEYRYCGYNEVVDTDGEYDFTKIDRVLDEIAGRGHQAVLRFYFCYVGKKTTVPGHIISQAHYNETVGTSEGKKTHFCDWSNTALQEFTLEFYKKLAERYDSDPRIAFLQTGFGLWAEYHIYEGPRTLGQTFPRKKFQARFLRHLDKCFDNLPWSISVDAADYDYSPLEDNDELLGLEFGVFDDSFLCKEHPKFNAANWRTLGTSRWHQSPGGGEFSYYNKKDQRLALSPKGPNGVSVEAASKQFHVSYMIGNDQPRYQDADRIRSAGMAMGYRFRITKAELSGSTLTLTVTNEGVAPIYRDAYFTAGNHKSAVSLRGLLPGEMLVCGIDGVSESDCKSLTIESNFILDSQEIQFNADLR